MNPVDETGYARNLSRLRTALNDASAIVVGAGAGLSTAAGLTYSGERFERLFGDFIARYGLRDMYSAGFYPFPTPEEKWAYWSRHIWANRYEPAPKDTYAVLRDLLRGHDVFVLTTNVDHRFQEAGFSKERLFYTQGDYGLWQCSVPCHAKAYDNRSAVERMVREQKDCRIPAELVPRCPVCGEPMAMNLRCDDTFVEDAGWHAAQKRYHRFLDAHETGTVLYLELGVGANTPAIIKYPFWRRVLDNPQASYACLNYGEAFAPREIEDRSIVINADTDAVLRDLACE
ncbi:SIR2 family NAD-dependent protein deacylase [Hugonella massiliensis]|uniref:SIR2 family NAD-dependent protein deacylase n=1 Tax=Hugonella massiliensis TaxID=1720315 RepID=UPI00073EF2BF|nr:hypothetical protein [Hugonella massiliensis]